MRLDGKTVTGHDYCEGCKYFEVRRADNPYVPDIEITCEHIFICERLEEKLKGAKNDFN